MLTGNFVHQIDTLPQHLIQPGIHADVLRLDLIHPIVSGNKWFKLKEHLAEARREQKSTVTTFGGAYSNHIIATAAACKEAGSRSVGIIRGEEPKQLSFTLQQAMELGMQLRFISREEYKNKIIPEDLNNDHNYVINEGGYGLLGMKGAKDIAGCVDYASYTHILAAVGTGTTLSGLIEASGENQTVVGISALKNNLALQEEINTLLSGNKQNAFTLLHDYHFGGYAKHTPILIAFMNEWFQQTAIPLDFVYTGKLFYAFRDLCNKNFFSKQSKVLLVHSGGLQGNQSLKNGTLIF